MSERALVSDYIEKRAIYEDLKEQTTQAYQAYQEAERNLAEAMLLEGKTRTAKYDDLGFVSLEKPSVYASCTKEMEPELFSWLIVNGMDSLIKQTVHHKSLSTLVKSFLDENKPIPEFIKYYEEPRVKLYKGETNA